MKGGFAMKKNGEQATNDDVLDIRIRFLRRESPMLFRAIEQFSGRPGDRARNGFIRQLMEMGLVVQEERMRRMDGLSTRISGGLVDEVMGAVSIVQRPAAPSQVEAQPPHGHVNTEGQASVTASAPGAPRPAVPETPSSMAAPGSGQPAEMTGFLRSVTPTPKNPESSSPTRDDDRPPPRVPGFTGRRMLAGESLE
ncbi:hypothetical protein [Variovorax sp. LjRoot175]|uniref:hypothetical protein n=1 Tax=Variovorax sp. LjRoot175 TaxID=3342276 RepID=UPI003F519341